MTKLISSLPFLLAIFYLLGGIPTGLIVGKIIHGIDPRIEGSGNIGATNLYRIGGKGVGLVTFSLDIVKFVIPAFYVSHSSLIGHVDVAWLGVAAMLGHCYSPFLKLKGGKGVTVSLAVLALSSPTLASITVVFWVLALIQTRYVSLASILAASLTAILSILSFTHKVHVDDIPENHYIAFILMAILIVVRHIDNIKRIRNGEEPKAY